MTLRRVFATAAVVALLSLVGLTAYAWSQGFRFYAVQSDSMTPAFRSGDLVIDSPTTSTTRFAIGDVITFHPTAPVTTTHRVAFIDSDGITTKGDANATTDAGQIQPAQVIGKVAFAVPFGGYVAVFLQQPAGLAATLLMLVTLALIWELMHDRHSASPVAIIPELVAVGPSSDADTTPLPAGDSSASVEMGN